MKSEELQQFVLSSLGGCSWEYDLRDARFGCSDEFFELLGYRPGEIEFDSDWVEKNIHPEDLVQWRAALVHSIKGINQYFDCDLRIAHKNGHYIWIQVRGAVAGRDDQGRALRVVGLMLDIDERKSAQESEQSHRQSLDSERVRVQEALIVSERRYRRLFDSAPAVLGHADWSSAKQLVERLRRQGVEDIRQYLIDHPELTGLRTNFMQLVDVNQEALKVFHSPSKESLIRFLNQPLKEEARLGLIEDLVALDSGERRSIERAWAVCETGETIPIVRVSELSSSDPGDWSQVLISVRDVSAEEAVRMSEIRFRRLFESSPAALYESDWSNGKRIVDRLRQEGVEDMRQHLTANPQLIRRRDDVHTILNANDDAIAMFLSSDKESHIRFIEGEVTDDQRQALIEVLVTFASGKRRSQFRTTTVRENGGVFPIVRNCELISSDREDWSLVLVSIQDLSIEAEAARQLEAYQQELRSLAGKISSAEESERRRISSELHDGTIQNLVLARIHLAKLLSTLDGGKAEQLAASIDDLLESSLRETRSLIFEISPPVLYELGLKPAVEWLAEHYRHRTGASITISGEERTGSLSEEMNIVVFQTARELLVNIAKHARAKQVSINWCHDNDRLVLTVEDDGVGFDADSPKIKFATEGGFGLFAVKERLKLLGAELDIQSSDQGTRATIKAPNDGGQDKAAKVESA